MDICEIYHKYDYTTGISYPSHGRYDQKSRLNGPHIQQLANVTANNLRRLELDIESDNVVKAMHETNERNNKVSNRHCMFTKASDMNRCNWKLGTRDDWSDNSMTEGAVKSCYLCSINPNHQKIHHAKPRKVARRVVYQAPLPRRRPKSPEAPPLPADERVYKVIVKTGSDKAAASNGEVYLTIVGQANKTTRRRLAKGILASSSTASSSHSNSPQSSTKPPPQSAAKTFTFGRSSTQTFHWKAPYLGELEYVVVEQTGTEKRHDWQLLNITVELLSSPNSRNKDIKDIPTRQPSTRDTGTSRSTSERCDSTDSKRSPDARTRDRYSGEKQARGNLDSVDYENTRKAEVEDDTGNWLFHYDGWLAYGIDAKGVPSGRAEHLLQQGSVDRYGRDVDGRVRSGGSEPAERSGHRVDVSKRGIDSGRVNQRDLSRDKDRLREQDGTREERKGSLRPSSRQAEPTSSVDRRKRSVTWDVGGKGEEYRNDAREPRQSGEQRRASRVEDSGSRSAERGDGRRPLTGHEARRTSDHHANGLVGAAGFDDVDSGRSRANRGFRRERGDPRSSRERDDITVYSGTGVAKIRAKRMKASIVEWSVSITTADKKNASTTSNVYITLYGKLGVSKKLLFPVSKDHANNETKKGGIKLERGQTARASMVFKDIGTISRIRVEQDNSGHSPDWLLDQIAMSSSIYGSVLFMCCRWLRPNARDIASGFRRRRDTDCQKTKTRESWKSAIRDEDGGRDGGRGGDRDGGRDGCRDGGRYGSGDGIRGGDRDGIRGDVDGRYFSNGRQRNGNRDDNDSDDDSDKDSDDSDSGRDSDDSITDSSDTLCDYDSSEDEGNDDALFYDLFPVKSDPSKVSKHDAASGRRSSCKYLDYEVTVVTGKESYAGTDARVYLCLINENQNKSSEIQLRQDSNRKASFQKGKTDTFNIKLEDIGDLDQLIIRHDNSGIAAGWFLDSIKVRRYFPKSEINKRLEIAKLKNTGRKNSSGAWSSSNNRRESRGKFSLAVNGSTSDSDSDSDSPTRGSRRRRETDRFEEGRQPLCDEYSFECGKWLSNDAGQQLSRRLSAKSVTTFFKIE